MVHMDEYGYEREKLVPEMLEVKYGKEIQSEVNDLFVTM